MRNILYFSIFVFLLSCGKDEIETYDNTNQEDTNPMPSKEQISFSENRISLTPNNLSCSINIISEVDFSIRCTDDENTWIKYNLQGSNLTISANPNNEEIEKKATFILINEEDESISDTLTVIQPINKERIALIKIYKALNGDNWSNNDNWCSNIPIDEWEGVYANGDMEVYRLWLSHDAYVEGEIPECLGDLIYLDNISFEYTNVRGKLPERIGNLTNLKRITISNCKLEGTIPESIKECDQLEYIDISNNNFEGKIPESFFHCENISRLMLNENKFSVFEINEMPTCEKLVYISISDNNIHSNIPENLFLISSLESFYASNNMITGEIPDTFSKALNLRVAELNNNKIEGNLPSNISEKSKLSNLNLRNNNLRGGIPDCFFNLSNLDFLDIRMNDLDIAGLEYLEEERDFWNIYPQRE